MKMEFEMNRAYLIDTLRRQGICATVVSTADGLRYEYITPTGVGISDCEIKSWPALKLKGLGDEKWANIRSKLKDGSLTHDDLKGTEFFYLHEDVTQGTPANPVAFFKDMLSLPDTMDYDIYCLVDMANPAAIPQFFNDEKSFLEAFDNQYCKNKISWDEVDEDYLRELVDRFEQEFGNFQYLAYS